MQLTAKALLVSPGNKNPEAEETLMAKITEQYERKRHRRATRDLVIIKTPGECWDPRQFSIHDRAPDRRPGFNSSDFVLQSSRGQV